MIYVILALILAAAVVYALYIHGVIKFPASVPVAPPTPPVPTVVNTPAPVVPHANVTDLLFHGAEPSGTQNPTGTLNLKPEWTAFDGHYAPVVVLPAVPVVATVSVPSKFKLVCSQVPGTTDAKVSAVVTKDGQVQPCEVWNGPPEPSVTVSGNPGDKFSISLTVDKPSAYKLTLQRA